MGAYHLDVGGFKWHPFNFIRDIKKLRFADGTEQISAAGGIIGQNNTSALDGLYGLRVVGGVVTAQVRLNGTTYVVTGTTTVSNDAWHFLVMTIKRTGFIRLYVDNVEEGSAFDISSKSSFNAPSTTWFDAGFNRNSSGTRAGFESGSYDQAAVWYKELTSTERGLLFNSGNGLAFSSFTESYMNKII